MAETHKTRYFKDIDLDRFAIAATRVFQHTRLTIFVTKNRTEAYLLVEGDGAGASLERAEELCASGGISLGAEARERIRAYLVAGGGNSMLIAQGKAPQHGTDSRVEWHVPMPQTHRAGEDMGDRLDYRQRRSYVRVEQDQHILTVHPPTRGEPGYDIKGALIPALDGAWIRPLAGDNVRSDQAQRDMFAAVAGQLDYDGERIHVRKLLSLMDVDFTSGNVAYDGEVEIQGRVHPGFRVEAKASVFCAKSVEDATILGENIAVGEAVTASTLVARGRIDANRCESSTLRSNGDMALMGDAVNCTIHCGGRLLAPAKTMAGGLLHAIGGVEVGWLGGKRGDATRVVVALEGIRLPALDAIDETITACREKIARLVTALGPLKNDPLAVLKLPPDRRSAIAKLSATLSSLELELQVYESERGQMLAPFAQGFRPVVVVTRGISPGVQVRIKDLEWTCPEELSGAHKVSIAQGGRKLQCESEA